MKSALFARPNLKLFLLGAVGLVGLRDVLTQDQCPPTLVVAPSRAEAREPDRDDGAVLLQEVQLRPSSQSYLRLCLHFEKKGQYRNALFCLREADKLASFEDSVE